MPPMNVHEQHVKKEKKNSNYIVCIPVVIMPSIRLLIRQKEPTIEDDVTIVAYRHSARPKMYGKKQWLIIVYNLYMKELQPFE